MEFFRGVLSYLSKFKKTLEFDALYLEILGIKVGTLWNFSERF